MTNQSEEILNYIKENPGASVEDIVRGTGWNRHLVEVAVKLMVGFPTHKNTPFSIGCLFVVTQLDNAKRGARNNSTSNTFRQLYNCVTAIL